jgi:hypothetical protein
MYSKEVSDYIHFCSKGLGTLNQNKKGIENFSTAIGDLIEAFAMATLPLGRFNLAGR